MRFPMIPDDPKLNVIRRDISGGVNSRQNSSIIGETQVYKLYNAEISIAGESAKRRGLTLVEDLGTTTGTGAFGFEPRGGTNELLVTHAQKLEGYTGTGTFTEHKTDFTTGLQTTIIKASCSGSNGDIALVSNGTDNVFQMLQAHTMQDCLDDNYACPKTTVITFFNNRVWALKSNLLYWSSALPTTYVSDTAAGPFDRTTQNYNITVGVERALIGLRTVGLIVLGSDAVYGIVPSQEPAATDVPEKILDIGCVAGKTACQVGDDVLFLSSDGVRGVFRTQQDKLQMGQSFPLSYSLKEEFDAINWAYITKACAIYHDNKYFLALPSGSSTVNNQVWVYTPAAQSWVVYTGWNIAAWAKIKFSGQERLYAIDSTDAIVYRTLYGYNDNGTAINYQEEGRKEDLGQSLIKKFGGEFGVKVSLTGSYIVKVYINPDDAGYTYVGDVASPGAFVTFPTTFPVSFPTATDVRQRFNLDQFGEWYQMQYKLQHNALNTSDIKVLERDFVTYPSEYLSEE